jgi:tetratricopeptide (TPR) repeat protein
VMVRAEDPAARAKAYALYAQALAYAGKIDAAFEQIHAGRMLGDDVWNASGRVLEAEVHYMSGDREAAKRLLARAGGLTGDDTTHREMVLFEIMCAEGKVSQALRQISQRLAHAPRSWESWLLQVAIKCAALDGQLKRAAQLERRHHELLRSQGLECTPSYELMLASGKAVELLQVLREKTAKLDESVPETLRVMAWTARVHARLGHAEEARAAITEARALMERTKYRSYAPEIALAERDLAKVKSSKTTQRSKPKRRKKKT